MIWTDEMPKSCAECVCLNWLGDENWEEPCCTNGEKLEIAELENSRHENCPLLDIAEHDKEKHAELEKLHEEYRHYREVAAEIIGRHTKNEKELADRLAVMEKALELCTVSYCKMMQPNKTYKKGNYFVKEEVEQFIQLAAAELEKERGKRA